MIDDIAKLKKQIKQLEAQIEFLENRTITVDNARLNMIMTPGRNQGKWAISFKYNFVVYNAKTDTKKEHIRWVPICCLEQREDAVKAIPETIKTLEKLYEKVIEKNGDDARCTLDQGSRE